MDSQDLKHITAHNIIVLRTANHMTQYELGEKINYSDKAISRWERGEAVPDAYVLLQLSKIFSVTVDFLLSEHTDDELKGTVEKIEEETVAEKKENAYDYIIITALSFTGVWALAFFLFIILNLFGKIEWIVFVYTLPISIIVLLVFNSIWGKHEITIYIVSLLSWSVISAVYISFLLFMKYNWWLLFLLGLFVQAIICLAFRIKKRPHKQSK